MGYFLGVMASAGIKIIVETHSDHIVNGIQIAVAEEKIKSDLVTINFFSHKANGIQPDVRSIKIKEKGELTNWPKGFFDQTQIDYAHLINLRIK